MRIVVRPANRWQGRIGFVGRSNDSQTRLQRTLVDVVLTAGLNIVNQMAEMLRPTVLAHVEAFELRR